MVYVSILMNTHTYSEMSSMRAPKELLEEINSMKILDEEPSYKVVMRLLAFFKEHQKEEVH